MNHITALNAAPVPPVPQEVRFLAQPGSEAEAPKELTLSAASLPVLSKHHLGMFTYYMALSSITLPQMFYHSAGVLSLKCYQLSVALFTCITVMYFST